MIGTSLGPYKIIEQLGAGGMGEVYLGEDTRLGRKVAIKVLPAEFAADPERLARFEQEAQAAATLNHPNIAAIYDVGFQESAGGETPGTHYMVQEYLEGQTLRHRMDAGTMPMRETIDIARDIARALVAAHAAGIVHRDLKPANLFLTKDGPTKVLDFGLAKLVEAAPMGAADASMSPTIVGTTVGQVLGTAGYMAPEQVQGQQVDRRADLFAFGCVLHEMLTGARAFPGRTVHQTLDMILSEEPEAPADSGVDLPQQLEWIRSKCLAKETSRRYQDADDLAVDLDRFADDVAAGRIGAVSIRTDAGSAPPSMGQVVRSLPGMALLLVAVIASIAAAIVLTGSETPPPDAPTPITRITRFSTMTRDPVISPSGQMLAFIANAPQGTNSQIWIKSLPDGPPQQLTRTPDAKAMPTFSPDGSRIAYTVFRDVLRWDTWVVPIVGGEPRLMLRDANSLQWTPDGRLIFSEFRQGIQLAVVTTDASGADRRDVWVPERNQMAHHSDVSPDGQSVIIGYMGVGPLSPDSRACFVRPLADGGDENVRMIGGGDVACDMYARWSADGEWIYFRAGGSEIWREPAAGGTAERVFDGRELNFLRGTYSPFTLMPDGLSMVISAGEGQRNLKLRDPSGVERQVTFSGDAYNEAFSGDGSTIYYTAAGRNEAGEIWEYRKQDDRRRQVCSGFTATGFALSPDARQLVLETVAGGQTRELWVCTVDGSEPPMRLYESDEAQRDPHVSPDGSTVYFAMGRFNDGEIWRAGIDGSDPRMIVADADRFDLVGVSPDGRWLSVSRRAGSLSEAWLYPTSGDGDPRFLMRGWELRWAPGNTSFMFSNVAMISTAWVLANPEELQLPVDVPDYPGADWFESVGARRVLSVQSFVRPAPSPTPFEIAYSSDDARANLFRLELGR